MSELTAVIALAAIAIDSLAGLDEVRARLQGAEPVWMVALAFAEVGSCVGYLLVFRSTFGSQMGWGLSYEIAMAEQAANSLLPAGGAGGLAFGVWALRKVGIPAGHIARRTVAFVVVTSAANFFALVLVGFGAFVGILAGSNAAILTLLPALIAALVALVVCVSPRLLRALERRTAARAHDRWRGRITPVLRAWLRVGADGVEQAISLLRSHSFCVIVGSFAYLGFDIAALGFGFAAVGVAPAFSTLVLGYLIGQLGNLIPLPGGVGGTEGALIGTFVLYGVNLRQAAASILIYRLLQLLVPALLGAPAFVMLRRRLGHADQPR
ncbi:MAG: lysylphosphatidylglycerol synthase transmembrane domain-containing protein [Solirubrobacteraceae bacterium]